MNFKRSFWGYSPSQVEELINEQSLAFAMKKNQLESELESIHQSGQKLNQMIGQLRNKYEQAYKQQQVIESSRPVLEQLLQKLQEYTVSQEQSSSRENAAHLTELAAKTAQIEADQKKLMRFWQNLHDKLGDLLNTMELEESTGKSLMNKYYFDVEAQEQEAAALTSPAVQEALPAFSVHDDLLPEINKVQENTQSFNDESLTQLHEVQQPEAFLQETAPEIPAAVDEQSITPQENQQEVSLQAQEQSQFISDDKIWSITPRGDQSGMELQSGDLNENPDSHKTLITPQDELMEINLQAANQQEPSVNHDWKAVLPDFSTAAEPIDPAVQEPLPEAVKVHSVTPDKPSVFNPFNTIKPDASLIFDAFKAAPEQAADSLAAEEDGNVQPKPVLENVSQLKEAEPSYTASPAAMHRQQALILDHDATILAMLRIILQRDGFSITEYMDGYQASQNIDYIEPPMVAILEANAPIINAQQLIRKIRNKPGWEDCAIIVLTENTNEQGISELLAAGADDYINKPVNTRELVSRIRRLTGISVVAL